MPSELSDDEARKAIATRAELADVLANPTLSADDVKWLDRLRWDLADEGWKKSAERLGRILAAPNLAHALIATRAELATKVEEAYREGWRDGPGPALSMEYDASTLEADEDEDWRASNARAALSSDRGE